jgi:hypothetical protein
LANLPPEQKQKMLVDAAKIAHTTKHEVQSRTTLARSETEIVVAATMSATGAKRHTKVLSASETAAQAALWAVLDLVLRVGITNIPKGRDFLTAESPKYHPALSIWWERTSPLERAERLTHYLALADPDLRRLVTALEESLDISIVSTAHFQADNITDSFSNIRNASFCLGVRRVQHLPLPKAKGPMHYQLLK